MTDIKAAPASNSAKLAQLDACADGASAPDIPPARDDAQRAQRAEVADWALATRKDRRNVPGYTVDGPDDPLMFGTHVGYVFGTSYEPLACALLNQAVAAQGALYDDPTTSRAVAAARALSFVAGVKPDGEVESALAAQMFAIHTATMTAAARLASASDEPSVQLHTNLLSKLARTFTMQAEALDKLRGGGKQHVTVVHEHRHTYVAPGGQAVTGDIVNLGGRPGGSLENQGQSYGATRVSSVPSAEVWREDPAGHDVPIARGERSEEMSNPRGDKPRRSKRPG